MLLYHLVCPVKYRKKLFTDAVEKTLKETCQQIEERYEIVFIEIGCDNDHVHFLVQSIPTIAPYRIVQMVKSITSREIQRLHPEIKLFLWGGAIWTSGYYINTVGQYANENTIQRYVQNQGRESEYKKIHTNQLKMF